ncbi:cytochrome b [Magnetospirillum fulvum]|uniref:Cytochrome B561 n=1 Tax=Magnetospirillum fulvum MGU-K5 TaxID=1316936 RepID=S9SDV7_MAGFU|nr:cytochrome b [Magnetospirillum fulvum]EPY02924.1 cytochrome B561 [Magnetospirillum fulvum MGU-K5]
MSRQSVDRFDTVTMAFHWGMALVILALWGAGHVIAAMLDGPQRSELIGLHKVMGVVILVLVLARLAWRFTHRPPRSLPGTPAFERLVSSLVHAALYALMLALPLVGILLSQSAGYSVTALGFEVPILVAKDPALHELFEFSHQSLGWVLALVLLAHIGAALRHHVVLKDATLRRMLPSRD